MRAMFMGLKTKIVRQKSLKTCIDLEIILYEFDLTSNTMDLHVINC